MFMINEFFILKVLFLSKKIKNIKTSFRQKNTYNNVD